MLRQSIGIVIGVIVVCLDVAHCRRLYEPSEEWNRQHGQPGVKLRLTKKGANHVKTVGVKLLNEQIAQLHGINTTQKFTQSGIEGTVDLQNIRVVLYKPPEVTVINFRPPKSIIFGMENMDTTLEGRFVGTVGLIGVPGFVRGDLKQMTLAITTDVEALPDGRMSVKLANCSTLVGSSQFTIDAEGPLGPLIKTFESQINERVREKIPEILCKTFKTIIEERGPQLFDRLLVAPLDGPFKQSNKNAVFDTFLNKLTGGLIIDNENLANPIVTNNYFETQQRGEVRYTNSRARTPFFPKAMNTTDESERMLYIYGSDYLFNSMLYHAYQNDRLTMKLEKSSIPPEYSGFLRTTCTLDGASKSTNVFDKVCVGSLIPALNTAYPNSTTTFILLPHGLPDFRFKDGKGSLDVKTRILTYARDGRRRLRQVLVSAAEGQADVRLRAEKKKVAGDLKLNKLDMHVHRSALPDMNPSDIEQLAPLAKTILGPQLSKGLKEGVPFPIQDTITFIDPVLTMHDGYVTLATDFELGEPKLRQQLAEAFRGGIGNIGG
uniref:Uncharacterized protein n=1 Tax=Plectus sambesii TaxID=2011161 RepID=A0A914WDW2_9BILA